MLKNGANAVFCFLFFCHFVLSLLCIVVFLLNMAMSLGRVFFFKPRWYLRTLPCAPL